MALLTIKNVLLLVIKLVIINEIVCYPLNFLQNNIFSGSLGYVSKHFNSVQPRFNLQKILVPTYTQKKYTPANADPYNGVSKLPTASSSKTNSAEVMSNVDTEIRYIDYNNNASQNSKIDSKDVDEKWNFFFDEYFKKLSKSETTDNINNKEAVNIILPTDKKTNKFNNETPQTSKNIIFDDENVETTSDSYTDTTDTTPFDYETTTGDDDLLRNGVPPELVASLLG